MTTAPGPPPLRPGEVDLDEIAYLVRTADVLAVVHHVGGGGAVVYAGRPYADTDGGPRYPAAAGPGRFVPSTSAGRPVLYAWGRLEDFTVGPDGGAEGEAPVRTAAELGVVTEAQAATVLIAQVLAPGRVLTVAEGRAAASSAEPW